MADHANDLESDQSQTSDSVYLDEQQDLNSGSNKHGSLTLVGWNSEDDEVLQFGDNLTRRSIRSGSSASIGLERFQSEVPESSGFQEGYDSSDYMSDESTSDLIKHGQENKEYVRHLKVRENTSLCRIITCFVCLVVGVLLYTVLIALVSIIVL